MESYSGFNTNLWDFEMHCIQLKWKALGAVSPLGGDVFEFLKWISTKRVKLMYYFYIVGVN